MISAARRTRIPAINNQRGIAISVRKQSDFQESVEMARSRAEIRAEKKTRVYVAAENRLLRDALSRMLIRCGDVEVVGLKVGGPFDAAGLLAENADILLLTARGRLIEDISVIRSVRSSAPSVRVLVVGMTGDEAEFFQYVRAGIKGYLPRDASAEEVIEAMRLVQQGEAVCPGSLCAALFHFLEQEATSLPSATVHHRLGLTRREQQIVPLIARGLTNKEIANHFCLSEQTVKNHLYRMKHKIGAGDRLGIVQLCRTQGFLV